MTIIISGHNAGLLDGSLTNLNRNDLSAAGKLASDTETYANVGDGDLVIQDRDVFLPSNGEDFAIVRTYNNRVIESTGNMNGWRWSTDITLAAHQDKQASGKTFTGYTMTEGDGTTYQFDFDEARNLWISTDGAGPVLTLQEQGNTIVVTRGDGTKYNFDKGGALQSIVDPNGTTTTFSYSGGRVTQVTAAGHTINYSYQGSTLLSISDESGAVLVRYGYTSNLLTQVTDRAGRVTTYTYGNQSQLLSLTQVGATPADNRTVSFTYQSINWDDHPAYITDFDKGPAFALNSIIDAMGAVTTFTYAFNFADTMAPEDRDNAYQPLGGRVFIGGSTRVVDALGHATTFTYDANEQLTSVNDPLGNVTKYTYDQKGNLSALTSENGNAAIASDSAYYRALRADLGFKDAAGNGKLVASLTQAEKDSILDRFTTRFTYDANSNVTSERDGRGNLTTYTYTAQNKLASMTAPMGNALTTLNGIALEALDPDQSSSYVQPDNDFYVQKRAELGYVYAAGHPLAGQGKRAADLTAAEKSALLALYTTTYTYDAKLNLTERNDPGGDLTRFTYDAAGNLTKQTVFLDASDLVTPAKQRVTTYTYDVFGDNTSITDALGKVTTNVFDHFGNMTSSVDPNGGVTTYTYNGANELLTITDPLGHTTTNAYDAFGNKVTVTDATGHAVAAIYNKNNLLIGTIDPSATSAALDRRETYTVDLIGERTQVTDAEGRVTTYTYDAARRLVQVITPQVTKADGTTGSYTTSYAYDAEGNAITISDNNGNVSQNLYTSTGLLKRVTDALGNVNEYLFDADAQQVQVNIGVQLAASARRILRYRYDEEDQLIGEVDALGATTIHKLDAIGNVVEIDDAGGNATKFEYDAEDQLIKETKADGRTVLHGFDAAGNEISTTDENGHVTTTSFDKGGKVVMVTDGNGIKTVWSYDSRDNVTSITLGADATYDATTKTVTVQSTGQAQTRSFVYDEFNQLIAQVDGVGNALLTSNLQFYQDMRVAMGLPAIVPAGGLTQAQKDVILARYTDRFSYDRVGNLVSETDHLGRVTKYDFDALDRAVLVTEAVGPGQRTTAYRYDGNNNILATTDPLGRVTVDKYDALNRKVETTDALGIKTAYEYDNVSNLTKTTEAVGSTNAPGRVTRFTYDLNDRLTSTIDAEGNTESYIYDAVGNRLRITDAKGGQTNYTYDARNRVVKVIDPLSLATVFEYDGVGNQVKITDPKGGVQTLTYDAGDRYIETTDAENRVTRFEYDRLGNTVRQTTAFGLSEAEVTSYVYDAEGNLRSVTDAKGVVKSTDFDAFYNEIATKDGNGNITRYAFDAFNRAISVTDPLGQVRSITYDAADNILSQTDEKGRVTSYAYDADNRRITETDPLLIKTTYEYDHVHNLVRITKAAGSPDARATQYSYDRNDRLTSETDPAGGVTRYEYDANDNLTKVVDPNGHATTYGYDADDRLTTLIDATGAATQYEYDANGNRTRVTDANNHATTFYFNKNDENVLTVDALGFALGRTYDGNGNLTSERVYATALAPATVVLNGPVPAVPTSTADRLTTFSYDKVNQLIGVVDATGKSRTYTYDAAGNQISQTNENARTTTFEYDANDRLVKQTDPLGFVRTFAYDQLGNKTAETDENGNTITYVYDANDQLLAETTPLGHSTAYTYDLAGNVASLTDANGHTTTLAYDLADRVVSQTDPLNHTRSFGYDAAGNQTSETDELGRVTRFEYDATNRLTKVTDPLGGVRTITYDAVGNTRTDTDENGHTTTYGFDANDQLTSRTDPLGLVTRYGFDAFGNQISQTDANGHVTTFAYDANDRLIGQTDPSGKTKSHTYDGVGNMLTETDENGQTTTFVYDADDRLTTQTDALGKTHSYSYDRTGNVLTETDENNHVTTYTYDAEYRVTSERSPLGAITRYEYDAVGNQTKVTDANGHVNTFAYDALDRLISQIDPLGKTRSFTYDSVGNKLSETDENGHATTYVYDANDRLTKETDALGHETTYAYDALGNKTAMTDAKGHTTTFAYDDDDRLTTQTDALGKVRVFTYDNVGNKLTDTDENNQKTTYTYDANDRIATIVDPLGKTRSYAYDGVGNKIAETDENNHTVRFEYDADDRLTKQTNGLGDSRTVTYDGVGNRLTETDENGHTTTYAYDADDRLTSEVDALGRTKSYTYDAVGNKTSETDENGKTTTYVYDALDRLTSQTDPAGKVYSYEYDAVGNKTAETDENNRKTTYAYDELDRLVTQTDPLGNQKSYTYDAVGNQTTATDELGHTTTYEYDALDRVTKETDPLGHTREYGYDNVGNRTSEKDENGNVTTYEYDANDRLTKETDALGNSKSVGYDAAGNKVSDTDEKGNTTTYTYDAADQLVKQTDSLGKSKSYEYDKAGNKTAETDENGNKTTFTYDDTNRVTGQVDVLGNNKGFTYDAAGNRTSDLDENGHTIRYAYDSTNNRVAMLTHEGFLTTYVYNAAGDLTTKNEYRGHYVPTATGGIPEPNAGDVPRVTTYTYDANHRVATETSPTGLITAYEYDAAGNKTAMIAGTNTSAPRRTEYRYDAKNQLVEVQNAEGVVTHYVLDSNGNIVQRHDAFGTADARVTTYTYDADNRVASETDAVGYALAQDASLTQAQKDAILAAHRTLFTYDAAGNLITRTAGTGSVQRVERFEYDGNGRMTAQVNGAGDRTEFGYDAAGNRTSITLAPGQPEQRRQTFEYDGENRLVAEVDAVGTRTEYRYDAVGNKVETTQAKGVAGEERHTLFFYDTDDRLTSVVDPIGYARANSDAAEFQGWRTAHGYAAAAASLTPAQVTAIHDTQRTTYQYDDAGNRSQITDANGVVTVNTFDIAGRILTNIVGVGGPHDGVKTTNVYDAFGNIVSSTQAWNDDGSDARITTYEYDKLDRQTRVIDAEGYTTRFTYDAFGNQTRIERGLFELTAASGDPRYSAAKAALVKTLTSNFTYDQGDRLLTSVDGEGDTVRSAYDALGNRISQTTGIATVAGAVDHSSTVTFQYDGAGRVTQKNLAAGGLVQIAYDKAGNQTQTRVLQSGSVATGTWSVQGFEYDGNGRVTAEIDPNNVRTERHYDKLGNEVQVDAAAGTADQRTRAFHYDLNSNLVAEIDGEGFAHGYAKTYEVDAVGNRIAQTDAEGRTTRFFYDVFNHLVAQVDPLGYYTAFTRDSAGNVLTTSIYMQVSATNPPATGEVRTITNTFDRLGRIVRQEQPDSSYSTFTYNSSGGVVQRVDYGATEAITLYDGLYYRSLRARLGIDKAAATLTTAEKSTLRAAYAASLKTKVFLFSYDNAGRLVEFRNGEGDASGNPVATSGIIERYGYDAANNKISDSSQGAATGTMANGQADIVHRASYAYDSDNRLVTQTDDPTDSSTPRVELNLVQSFVYDLAGNVVSKTVGGRTSTNTYDLANRVLTITNAASEVTRYGYDRVGNVTAVTDARGNVTNFEYDRNNRVTAQLSPSVAIYVMPGSVSLPPSSATTGTGGQTTRPTTTTRYDRVGNIVELTDANGFKTTRWYDADNRMTAELNGDLALREFEYDAIGALTSVTQHLDRLPDVAASRDLASQPTGTTNVNVVNNTLDKAGRVIRTEYPNVAGIATLSGTATDSPTEASYGARTLEELNYYDAFGNLVESVDRNGEHNLAYYDIQGRQIATVDDAGYLVETDYDSQGNVVEQRKYETAIGFTGDSSLKPTAPAGVVRKVDKVYDAAGRLVQETSPEVKTDSADVRVTTSYTYDAAGNMTSRSLGNAASKEYYYYDAANRRVAVVDDGRTLSTFGYDANGNRTSQRRYINPVPAAITLDTASLASVQASVSADESRDELTTFAYDALNRAVTQTDAMGAGTTDDIVLSTQYDAIGNVTWRRDGDGFVSQNAYDAARHVRETIAPNLAHSFVEYDTGGLKVKAWLAGPTGAQAPQATNITATVANGANAPLTVTWDQSGQGITSWVAWDSVSHAGDSDTVPSSTPGTAGSYGHATGAAGAGTGQSSRIDVAAAGNVYFRVVSRDSAGNLTWTEEKTAYVPPRISTMAVSQSGSNYVVTVTFTDAVTTPTLVFDGSGGPTITNSYDSGTRTLTATIANPSNPASLQFHVSWSANSQTFSTSPQAMLAGPGAHIDGGNGFASWKLPSNNGVAVGDSQLILKGGQDLTQAVATSSIDRINGTDLQFNTGLANGANALFDVFYGTRSGVTHTASVSFSQDQHATYAFHHYDTHDDNGTTVYDRTYYDVTWVSDALRTAVSVTLDATETANVSGSMFARTRTQQSGAGGFGSPTTLTRSSNTFSGALATNLANGTTYDIEIFYLDASGHEVIVEWQRITTPATPANSSGDQVSTAGKDVAPAAATRNTALAGGLSTSTNKSLTVLARELGIAISRAGNGTLTIAPGVYNGPIDASGSTVTLSVSKTANAANDTRSRAAGDSFATQTYYTKIVYNAVGAKIATNEDNGLWRVIGVDGQGNAVEEKLFGTEQAEQDFRNNVNAAANAPIVTFKTYDPRNLETAAFAAAVMNFDGVVRRAVTRSTYDYAGQKVRQQDSGATIDATFVYDGAGNVVTQTDHLGHSEEIRYDALGRKTSDQDVNGHTRRFVYDAAGNLVQESVDGVTSQTYSSYDAFGRRTTVSVRGASDPATTNITTLAYDQRDRLVSITDPLGHVTSYSYDGRDNQVWTVDANGHFFGQQYDAMGQLTHKYSFQTNVAGATTTPPTTLQEAKNAIANPADTHRASLVDEVTEYDIFGNKSAEKDGAGRGTFYTYGAFGRLLSISAPGSITSYTYDRFSNQITEMSTLGQAGTAGKNISRTYDAARQLTEVNDAGIDTRTVYAYDVAGNRVTESLYRSPALTGLWASQTYSYDANHRLTAWRLRTDYASGSPATDLTENYSYDSKGNLVGTTSTSGLNHSYTYDNADRVLTSPIGTITYDSQGRRSTLNDGTNTTTYAYDAAGRVTSGTSRKNSDLSVLATYSWTYDNLGNVTRLEQRDGTGKLIHYSSNSYDTNNLNYFTESDSFSTDHPDGYSRTTTNFDKSARTLTTVLSDGANPGDVKTYTYTYSYNEQGLQSSVAATGTGDIAGSTTSTYDVNGNLIRLDLGQGDNQDAAEYRTFIRNNDGQIIQATHFLDEKDKDAVTTIANYLYAVGNPVGEYELASGTIKSGTLKLDDGNYSVLKTISPGFEGLATAFPEQSVSDYVVQAGDTLQAIAQRLYGNPALWFVIADANGLRGSEQLAIGQRLTIPNTVHNGRIPADSHALYQESDIVGPKLPNLKSPPPPPADKCKLIAAIILVIIVAIVAVILTIVTVGAAAPAAAAALGFAATSAAGIIIGVAVGAVIGAAVAFTASVITQGILVGFGLQKEFDWKQVAADTVAGAFSGAAGGLGAAIEAAQTISVAVKVFNVIGQAALEVAGETTRQAIANDGRIDNPIGIALAGAGAAFGAVASRGLRAETRATRFADDFNDAFTKKVVNDGGDVVKVLDDDLAKGTTVYDGAKKFRVVESGTELGADTTRNFRIEAFSRVSALRKSETLSKATNTKFIKIRADLAPPNATLVSKSEATIQKTSTSLAPRSLKNFGKVTTENVTVGVFEVPRLSTLSRADRISAAGKRFSTTFRQILSEELRPLRTLSISIRDGIKGIGKLGSSIFEAARKAGTAAQKTAYKIGEAIGGGWVGFKSAAKTAYKAISEGASSAGDAVVDAVKRLNQSVYEFFADGRTVFKGGITKTVRYFADETDVNGKIVRVERFAQTYRKSFLKTLPKRPSDDIMKTKLVLEDVADAAGNINRVPVFKSVYRQSYLGQKYTQRISQFFEEAFSKLRPQKDAAYKTTRSYQEVATDTGQIMRVPVDNKVYRESFLGTSLRARFRNYRAEGTIKEYQADAPEGYKFVREFREITLENGQIQRIPTVRLKAEGPGKLEKIKTAFGELPAKFRGLVDTARTGIGGAYTSAKKGVGEALYSAGFAIGTAWGNFKSGVSTAIQDIRTKGGQLIDKAVEGFTTAKAEAAKAIVEAAKAAKKKTVELLKEGYAKASEVASEALQKAREKVLVKLDDLKEAHHDFTLYGQIGKVGTLATGIILRQTGVIPPRPQGSAQYSDYRFKATRFDIASAAKKALLSNKTLRYVAKDSGKALIKYAPASYRDAERQANQSAVAGGRPQANKFDVVKQFLGNVLSGDFFSGAPDAFIRAAAPRVTHGNADRRAGRPLSLFDQDAPSSFRDIHDRQSSWKPTGWTAVAAQLTTQIYSPFELDRASDLQTTLALNRMVSGQTGDFAYDTVVDFASRTVGHVAPQQPIPFVYLNAMPPDAAAA